MTNERSARPEDPPPLSVVMSAIIRVTKDKQKWEGNDRRRDDERS